MKVEGSPNINQISFQVDLPGSFCLGGSRLEILPLKVGSMLNNFTLFISCVLYFYNFEVLTKNVYLNDNTISYSFSDFALKFSLLTITISFK